MAPKSTGKIGEALTNSWLPAAPANLRAQVKELGGVKAVAGLAGRSVSSVYRWLRGDNNPNPQAKGALDQASTALRASSDYRRAQLKPTRHKRLRTHGCRFRFKGEAGPINASADKSIRKRDFSWDLSADAMGEVFDAWIEKGDEAALEVLADVLAGEYMQGEGQGWHFESIDLLNFSYSEF